MARLFKGGLVTALAIVALRCSAPDAAAQAPFSDMISFGDSLTDVGNVAAITYPGNAPVIPGYYQETHFSDNVIWDEMVASYWGLPARTVGRVASGTLSAQLSGNTWAWGSSESGTGTVTPAYVSQPIPNLLTEVSNYISSGATTPSPSTLYSIWSGADNLLVGGDASPAAALAAADSVETAMEDLDADGARNFLIFNMPKLGDTPYAQSSGAATIAASDEYSVTFNNELTTDVAALRSDTNFLGTIYTVDVYDELALVVSTVDSGGTYTPSFYTPGAPVVISNVTGTGLGVYDETGTDPTNYLFWDGVHPTTEGDQIITGVVLQAIPEPGTVVLILIGAGLACWHSSRVVRNPKQA